MVTMVTNNYGNYGNYGGDMVTMVTDMVTNNFWQYGNHSVGVEPPALGDFAITGVGGHPQAEQMKMLSV